VHVRFVLGSSGNDALSPRPDQTSTATVIQQSAGPRSATATAYKVGYLTAKVVPGQAWSLYMSGTGEQDLQCYLNGTASCTSTAPLNWSGGS
jgi:hypothetical protein